MDGEYVEKRERVALGFRYDPAAHTPHRPQGEGKGEW